jgi:hypothetical protein
MFIVYAALLPARNKLTAPDVTPLRARRGALEGISISSQRGSYSRRCHRDAALQDLAARAVPETRSPPRKTSSAPLMPPNCATDVGSQPTIERYKIVDTSARQHLLLPALNERTQATQRVLSAAICLRHSCMVTGLQQGALSSLL